LGADRAAVHQFFVDNAWDSYTDRDGSGLGVRKGSYQNYSVDASYAFTSDLQANAWYSFNTTSLDQATCESAAAPTTGAPFVCPQQHQQPGLVGGNPQLQQQRRRRRARQAEREDRRRGRPQLFRDHGQVQPAGDHGGRPDRLHPEHHHQLTRITVYGKYALEKNSGIRLDYVYDRYSSDDWTWQTWMYADGTRLVENSLQKVNFFLVSYYYRWR